jgi:hypothetical protein
MEPRLTIAIPIHAGAKWIDGILDTVSKAPEWSRVVISDATHRDDAIERLAELLRDDDRVTVKSRPETLDWIGHANLLLAEADTEYFCWMPQDDMVSPQDYFGLLVSALDENPDRVLGFPAVVRKATKGRFRKRPVGEVAYQSPPVDLGQSDPAEEAVRMLNEWNLALGCWRGVFRTGVARPAPATEDCADLIWAFSMALAGNFIEVREARYLKRFHRGSALHSMRWQGLDSATDLYQVEVEARLGSDPVEVERVMSEVHRYLRFRHRLIMFTLRYRPVGAFVLNRPRPVLE